MEPPSVVRNTRLVNNHLEFYIIANQEKKSRWNINTIALLKKYIAFASKQFIDCGTVSTRGIFAIEKL